jgi:hypothetical protein
MGYERQRGPRLKGSQQKKILLELRSQIEQLTSRLTNCADNKTKHKIESDLVRLRLTEETLDPKKWRLYVPRKKKVAPLPGSYISRRNEEREAVAHISGRKRIRAHFVQGGAPGSGKK